MSALVLNGTELAKKVKEELKNTIINEINRIGITPGLAVVIVGNDPASRVYVDMKKNDCKEVGLMSFEYALPENTSEKELLELINKLNNDKKVHGILVQLPLPKQINEERIINAIDPKKDADCFHPENVGKLMIGNPVFLPCTPGGIIELLDEAGVEIEGKECVVVGRSNIVGKPLAILLLAKNGTVTICHSKTKNLKEVCRRADILIAAVGRAKLIEEDFVKPDCIVIDVGVNRVDSKLVGDVDFLKVSEKVKMITKVTGGVGPMTRAILMKNTVRAAIEQIKELRC